MGVYASEWANPVRIRITAEVDGVGHDRAIAFDRYGRDNVAVGRAYARADTRGGLPQ
jgi:hypothetical protein